MKNKKLLPILVCLLLATVSCKRTCVCIGYDEQEHRYSEEEVEQLRGGNCANMVYQADTRYLSVCNWE